MANKRKIVSFLALSMIFIFSSFSFRPVEAEDSYAIQEIPLEIQRKMEQQIPALDAHSILESNLFNNAEANFEEDVYAGEYIEDNKLIIQLADASPADKQSYLQLVDYAPCVEIEDVEYSLDELEATEHIARILSCDYDIVSHGIDVKNNRYMVTVLEEDYFDLIEDELYVQNEDTLIVETTDSYPVACAATLYGGDRISKSNGDYMSLCIGGTYNGQNAILTAGHDNEGSPSYYRSGNLVGSVAYQRCNTTVGDMSVNSLGDFAIITLSSSFTPTNDVRNATSLVNITGTYSSLPVGTTIYKYGSTTGYSWGTVTYTSMTVQYKEAGLIQYEVRGLYQSSMQNSSGTSAIDHGDSGGAVYMLDGNSYKIHGTVSGGIISLTGVNTVMYSSPIYYAQDVGFTPLTN